MTTKQILDELEDQEIWTDQFGDRKCIGVYDRKIFHAGKPLKFNKKQLKALLGEYFRQELGNLENWRADLCEELKSV